MQTETTVTGLLERLAALLGPLSPFTKAVVPAALAVVVAVVNSLFSGTVDAVSLSIAGSGLVLALATFLLPNVPHVKPTPAPVVPPVKAGK